MDRRKILVALDSQLIGELELEAKSLRLSRQQFIETILLDRMSYRDGIVSLDEDVTDEMLTKAEAAYQAATDGKTRRKTFHAWSWLLILAMQQAKQKQDHQTILKGIQDPNGPLLTRHVPAKEAVKDA